MKQWFKQFFHPHVWRVIDQYTLTESGKPIGVRYVLQCSTCGKLKQKDFW